MCDVFDTVGSEEEDYEDFMIVIKKKKKKKAAVKQNTADRRSDVTGQGLMAQEVKTGLRVTGRLDLRSGLEQMATFPLRKLPTFTQTALRLLLQLFPLLHTINWTFKSFWDSFEWNTKIELEKTKDKYDGNIGHVT